MRLALIVDAYSPARTSAAVQMRDLARELRAQGHEPTVIVPSPTILSPFEVERIDEIDVLRVQAAQTKDVGKIRRAGAEALLSAAVIRGLHKSPFAKTKWDGVVWYSPTIFFGPLIAYLRRTARCPTYLILRDIFPDWALHAGVLRKGPAYSFFKLVERFQYTQANTIGVQSPANLRYFQDAHASSKPHVEVLNNWLATASPKTSTWEMPVKLRDRLVMVYAGNIGVAQGMDCLIELATHLRVRAEVGFLFVGRGTDVPRLQALVASRGLDNVVFENEVDPDELSHVFAQCHIGLLALDPRHKTHNIPGKFLTYVRAGLPVLARINQGNDLGDIIDQYRVGLFSTGEDNSPLFANAEHLLSDESRRKEMGERGRVLAIELFSAPAAARQITAALQRID